MKKIYLLFTFCLLSCYLLKAQAVEAIVDYKKLPQPAAVIELSFGQSLVEDAIKEKMKSLGYKASESKGFIVFSGIKDVNSGRQLSYVYKVIPKSPKEKGKSVVYLFLEGDGVDMSKTGPGSDMEMMKTNLNNLSKYVFDYNLNLQISEQTDKVKEAEKKLNNLQDEKTKLEKKKKTIEDDITENAKEQEKQKKELDKQKTILDGLVNQRK
jgi:hypothetical protein